METFKVEDRMPNQKDLVLVELKGVVMPAIYYKSMCGFFHFSLFYHDHEDNTYSKARTFGAACSTGLILAIATINDSLKKNKSVDNLE